MPARTSRARKDGRQVAVTCVIETPKGSRNKYEYDERLARMRLDRVLASSLVYPGDYGFLPETLSKDGDPLDVLVCTSEPTFPGCAITARAVALLRMADEHGRDEKVVCVPDGDPAWSEVQELQHLPRQLRRQIEHFFATYKELDPDGHSQTFGWAGRNEAEATIKAARTRYRDGSRSMPSKRQEIDKLARPGRVGRRDPNRALEKGSRRQLYDLAKERNVQGRSRMSKSQLIAALREAA